MDPTSFFVRTLITGLLIIFICISSVDQGVVKNPVVRYYGRRILIGGFALFIVSALGIIWTISFNP